MSAVEKRTEWSQGQIDKMYDALEMWIALSMSVGGVLDVAREIVESEQRKGVKVELEIGPAYGEVTLCVKGPKGWLTLIDEDDVGLTDLGYMEGYMIKVNDD